MKIPHKKEFQQIAKNHSCGIDFKELYSFLVNNTTLSSDNTLRFMKNVL